MKIAVIQLDAADQKKENVRKACSLVERAARKGARFIVLPEAYNFRGKAHPRRGYADAAESIPGPSTNPLAELARRHKIAILAGSIGERVPRSMKIYNTSVLIGTKGEIIAKYRKINLFDAVIGGKKLKESARVCPGRKIVVARVLDWTAGLSICYDLRFPILYQKMKIMGANLYCVPSSFTQMTGAAHWETLLRARAIESLCYVAAANQIGKDGNGVPSYGNSMIIDPWGRVLARASGNKQEIIYAHLKKEALKDRRKILSGISA